MDPLGLEDEFDRLLQDDTAFSDDFFLAADLLEDEALRSQGRCVDEGGILELEVLIPPLLQLSVDLYCNKSSQ
jgi:hypothetical protein